MECMNVLTTGADAYRILLLCVLLRLRRRWRDWTMCGGGAGEEGKRAGEMKKQEGLRRARRTVLPTGPQLVISMLH